MRGSEYGMTLIEMLVALALLSMLSVGLFAAFRLGEHSYQQVTRSAAGSREVLSVQGLVRRAIESSRIVRGAGRMPTGAHSLAGSTDHISFTAPMPLSEGARGDFRYELSAEPGSGGLRDLVAQWSLDGQGRHDSAPAANEILIAGAEEVTWSYFDAGDPERQLERRGWVSEWSEDRLPALVRLAIRFPPGDARVWPDLIAAPRSTDAAACQFDPVSQQCREVSL